jgi:hypothetical protein
MQVGALLEQLRARFPDRPMSTGEPPGPIARFLDVSEQVGDVEVYDNGGDFIVAVPRFTHTHFQTAGEVADFLDHVFAGRVQFFGSPKAGGYRLKGKRARTPIAGWMALAWLGAWVIALACYALTFLMERFIPGCMLGGKHAEPSCGAFTGFLSGLQFLAFYLAMVLIVVSVPWVVATVVVSLYEMRRRVRP